MITEKQRKNNTRTIAIATFILIFSGCDHKLSENEKHWDKREKAESKCEKFLNNGAKYGSCLKRAGYQDGKPMFETYNPLRAW
jgi:hypothetical protein